MSLTGCNFAPIAVDDEDETDVDTSVIIDVLANDSDPDGDPIEIDSATNPPNGTAIVNDNEPGPDTVTYVPDAGFTGTDTFSYSISDPFNATGTASVTVAVGGADADGDGIPDDDDNCPLTPNADQLNSDGDTLGDLCDNCTLVTNESQCDTDGDMFGNHCDADFDQSGTVAQPDLGIFRTGSADLRARAASCRNSAQHDCDLQGPRLRGAFFWVVFGRGGYQIKIVTRRPICYFSVWPA